MLIVRKVKWKKSDKMFKCEVCKHMFHVPIKDFNKYKDVTK
ncbi:hypothetical protein NT05LM_1949 [Listeria marthii FSL S4-120]|uniref:Uncharacterized protein n=2 Tax=Listeria marthii TaxID=529731 RepID=A0ABP2JZ93_9LIST|nr:hypothetical protein NT05LM_1949 [Listeria marthii FSL S4-120]